MRFHLVRQGTQRGGGEHVRRPRHRARLHGSRVSSAVVAFVIAFGVDAWRHVGFDGPIVLFVVAVGALCVAIRERSRDGASSSWLPLGIALACSLAAIFSLTLVPDGEPIQVQLVPFVHIVRGYSHRYKPEIVLNVVANALLFLPLGAALSLLDLRVRTTLLIAFSVSALIEITQLFVPGRTTSVDDVLLVRRAIGSRARERLAVGQAARGSCSGPREREHA